MAVGEGALSARELELEGRVAALEHLVQLLAGQAQHRVDFAAHFDSVSTKMQSVEVEAPEGATAAEAKLITRYAWMYGTQLLGTRSMSIKPHLG